MGKLIAWISLTLLSSLYGEIIEEKTWLRENATAFEGFSEHNGLAEGSYHRFTSREILANGVFRGESGTSPALLVHTNMENGDGLAGVSLRMLVIKEKEESLDSRTVKLWFGTETSVLQDSNSVKYHDAEIGEWVTVFFDLRDHPEWEKGAIQKTMLSIVPEAFELDWLAFIPNDRMMEYINTYQPVWIDESTNEKNSFVDSDSDGLADIEEAVLGTSGDRYDPPAIGEKGVFLAEEENLNQWITVNLDGVYEDPNIVLNTTNAIIRKVNRNSFEVKVIDAAVNEVQFLASEKGDYELPDGSQIQSKEQEIFGSSRYTIKHDAGNTLYAQALDNNAAYEWHGQIKLTAWNGGFQRIDNEARDWPAEWTIAEREFSLLLKDKEGSWNEYGIHRNAHDVNFLHVHHNRSSIEGIANRGLINTGLYESNFVEAVIVKRKHTTLWEGEVNLTAWNASEQLIRNSAGGWDWSAGKDQYALLLTDLDGEEHEFALSENNRTSSWVHIYHQREQILKLGKRGLIYANFPKSCQAKVVQKFFAQDLIEKEVNQVTTANASGSINKSVSLVRVESNLTGLEAFTNTEVHYTSIQGDLESLKYGFLGFFPTEVDQDADGLPDVWQRSNQLALGNSSGFYGDDDGDGLINYDEYLAGTSAYLADSDGDGLSDYEEVVGLNNPELATAIGEFQTVKTINGSAFSSTFGNFDKVGTQAVQATRRGSVTYDFIATHDGVHAVEFDVSDHSDGDKSTEHEFIISLNDKFISREYVALPVDGSASFSTLLPSLKQGESYSLTLYVDNSYNFRRVSIDTLILKEATGIDTNENGVPDWEEIRAKRVNGADQLIINSYTSPACVQGKAEFFEFLESSASVNLLPNKRWYADVNLNQGEVTTIQNTYEGTQEEEIQVNWTAIDSTTFNQDLQIRVGGRLLIQGSVGVSLASLTNSSTTNYTQPLNEILFSEAGTFTIQAETNTFQVEVVARPSVESTVAMVNKPRDWSFQHETGITLLHDKTVQPHFGKQGIVRISAPSSEDSLIAFETKSGSILSTTPLIYNRLRSGSQTGVITLSITEENQVWRMPMILDKHTEGLAVVNEIFIGGVTFQDDGSIIKEVNSGNFNYNGYISFDYILPNPPHSNCHRNKVNYRGETISRYK